MDVVIFCGGKGTRMGNETVGKPKPMTEVGGMPILWHIMKIYAKYGHKRFILPLGYKGDIIKNWFHHNRKNIDWDIVFVDTGTETLKGGRLKIIEKEVITDKFHLTYGDGVSNINLDLLEKFHNSHNGVATLTAVMPPSRFGCLTINEGLVDEFEEKPRRDFINGGFFILNKEIFNYLHNDGKTDFEYGSLKKLSDEKKLYAYKHLDFWHPMDSVREKEQLDKLCENGTPPWLI